MSAGQDDIDRIILRARVFVDGTPPNRPPANARKLVSKGGIHLTVLFGGPSSSLFGLLTEASDPILTELEDFLTSEA